MTEGLPELTDAELEEIRLDAYGRPGYAQARGCDTQQAKLLLAEVHRLRAALREASRPQEAGNMLASPPATRFATDEELAASPPETAPALDLDKLALHPYRISRGNWTRCPVTDESEFEPCDDADVVTVREALLVCRQLATEIERLRAAHGSRPAGRPEMRTHE